MKLKLYSLPLALAATATLSPFAAYSQGITTGSISGSVADPTGAVIPGATITATADATKIARTITAGKDGAFSFKDMPIGTYTVVITSSGFSTITLNNVQVASARDQGLGVEQLTTGGTSSTVEVSAAAAILETSQSQVTTTFDSQQLTSLPTAGGFDALALLIPGVVSTGSDRFSNSNGAGLSVNGERGRSDNFEIDGQTNNDTTISGPQFFFGNDEALAEEQVITNSFSAQYGRNAGSVVNYITKSGTNEIHGSAIYKFSGDFTSSLSQGYSKGTQFGFCAPGQTPQADGCATPVVPRYVDNYYGGTLGGPIIKDKLFAFGSTYWYKFREYGALQTTGGSLFPTPAGLAALAQAFPGNAGVAVLQTLNPYAITTGNPHAVGTVTTQPVTVGGTTVQIPFSAYGRQLPSLTSDQEDLGRIDWQATPKDRFFVRYMYQSNPTSPYNDAAIIPDGSFATVSDVTHSVGADFAHTFGPHWVNQLRYSFQQSTLAFNIAGFPNCTIASFTDCPSSLSISSVSGSPFSAVGVNSSFPQGRVVKVGQLQDNASWSIGKHQITFGGEFDATHAPNVFLPNSSGAYSFDNLNDFLAGGCASGCYANVTKGNPTIAFAEYDAAAFFQDDWRATSSLTLNLGLRWEFYGEPLNGIHNQDVAQQTGPNPLWSTALPLTATTTPHINNYYKNFEPRLGFAFNPDFNKKLVVRGAYAINVDPQYQNIVDNVAQSAPAVIAGAVTCNAGANNCFPSGGLTYTTAQQNLASQLPTGGNPALDAVQTAPTNFRFPIGQTYSLGLQYQIRNSAVFELRYVGNHTSRQFQNLDTNPYLADVAAAFPNFVNPNSLCSAANSTLGGADVGYLHCGATSVDEVANTAFSNYQSVQTELTTQNFHGLTGTVAYTYSHNIDNSSEVYSTGGGGNTVSVSQNPLDTNYGERGNSSLDFPNVASIGLVYAFPKAHSGHTLLDRAINGWQGNAIYSFTSGQTYTDFQTINSGVGAVNPNDARTSQSYGDLPFEENFVGVDVERPILSNPQAPKGTLGIYTTTGGANGAPISAPFLADAATGAPVATSQVHWIVNNQLAANIIGNPYPGAARHLLRGDTTNNLDFSMIKDTNITERVTFRLEVDAFDILNRAFYSTPGNNTSDYLASGSYFNNFQQSYASGTENLSAPGTGARNLLFTGKIRF